MRTTMLKQQPFRASKAQVAPRGVSRRVVVCRAAAPALTDVERKALSVFEATGKTSKEETLRLLVRAGLGRLVDQETVEGAILHMERLAGQDKSGPTPSIAGRWRLVFGTATKFRPFQYIPVKEDFVLDAGAKTVALESSIGPFEFFIRGVMNAWKPESGELDFQFNKVDINLFGEKKWEVTPKTKPKTYTFFYVADDLALARSSAGGVALLIK
ncbi:hypothetical protein HYH02_001569 [Chlamydomonas schloesseri]|uniref:Plastid lipid-associated protein/fibrillin conserved domain-containing protein n=1 Tax=Chlamydomonas schloesseri TaxID=2026947 RepID=A0A835WVQ8_9CHLO|nr:hypothetical protein HYH02_001569 [Chlamydomonas schloesseri]|eukprot:KAG2453345.1 hypothetical protein HYH02_001569 [Chlamydomonas schloesseri]